MVSVVHGSLQFQIYNIQNETNPQVIHLPTKRRQSALYPVRRNSFAGPSRTGLSEHHEDSRQCTGVIEEEDPLDMWLLGHEGL